MYSRITYLIIIFAGLFLSSCSAPEPKYDFDKSVDFSSYKTFTRKEAETKAAAGKAESPILNMKFSEAIDSVIAGKGYIHDSENPDFVVTYVSSVEFLPNYGTTNFEKWQGAWSKSETSVLVTKGVIVIDIIDAHTGKLIWRGWDTELVGELPRNIPEKIRNVVSTILENFPARGK
ncbi:MAG: DUF4136 domain-containing protein [Ignavibacteriaceae bacterium]|nr:DUF4136 domain-containing protein [Ignavibacteriaceae bacterium]